MAAKDRRIAVLGAENIALWAGNAELKRRLGQNSRKSSKPPSSDRPEQVPAPRSLRRKAGRNPGKQAGVQGFSLQLVDDPDETLDYLPECCRGCGSGLDSAVPAGVGGLRPGVSAHPGRPCRRTGHRPGGARPSAG